MQRRSRIEDRNNQVVTKFGVEPHAGVDDSLQTDIPFDYDQRAGLCRCQSRGSQYNFVINALAKLAVMTARKRHAKAISKTYQGLPNFGLKKHDDDHANVKQRTTQNEFERSQTLINGEPIQKTEYSQPGCHRSGTGATQKFQDAIDQQKHQYNVDDRTWLCKPGEVVPHWYQQEKHVPAESNSRVVGYPLMSTS